MLEPLVPTESSQDKGNFPVRSHPEENYPEWKPAFIRARQWTTHYPPCIDSFIETQQVVYSYAGTYSPLKRKCRVVVYNVLDSSF